jgi:light-regulated signal transduction histidine kinase (bacteriophytochrome)
MWRFAITDNGIGIEPRFADRIFVIFQRLHGRDMYGGTGIGLALCKKIVEFHGGEIWLDTGYSPGARICWALPTIGAE